MKVEKAPYFLKLEIQIRVQLLQLLEQVAGIKLKMVLK